MGQDAFNKPGSDSAQGAGAQAQARNDAPSSSASTSSGGNAADGFLSTITDLERRINALKSMHEQASSRDAQLDARERELAERERTAKLDHANLAAERQKSEALRAELEAATASSKRELASLREQQDAQTRALQAQAAQIALRERELEGKQVELDKRLCALNAEGEATRQELAIIRAQLDAATSEADSKANATLNEIEARESDLAEREKDVSARLVRAEAQQERGQRVEEELRTMRAQLDDQHQSLRQLESDLKEREFDLREQASQLERDRAGVAEHARTLAEQMRSSQDEENAAIWSNRMETLQLGLGEATAARAKLETELGQAREDIEQLTQELIESNATKGVPVEEVSKRDRTITGLQSELEEMQATLDMLQAENESGGRQLKDMQSQRDKAQLEYAEKTAKLAEDAAKASKEAERLRLELQASHGQQSEATKRMEALAQREAAQAQKLSALEKTLGELKHAKGTLEAELVQAKETIKMMAPADAMRERESMIAGLQQALAEAERAASDLLSEQVGVREGQIKELEAKLTAHAEEVKLREVLKGELERAAATLGERDTQLNALQVAMQSMVPADVAEAHKAKVEVLERDIAEAREVQEKLRSEAEALAARCDEAEVARLKLSEELQESEVRCTALESAKAESARIEAELAERDEALAELKGQLAEAQAHAELWRDKADAAQQQVASVSSATSQQAATEVQKRDRHIAELSAQLENMKQALSTAQEAALLAASTTSKVEHGPELATLREAVHARDTRIEEITTYALQLEAQIKLHAEAQDGRKEANPESAAQIQELKMREAELNQTVADLEAKVAQAGKVQAGPANSELVARLGERDETISRLQSHLERVERALQQAVSPAVLAERDRMIAELQTRLDAEQTQGDGAQLVPQDEVIKRDQAIELLKERLEQAISEREELQARFAKTDANEAEFASSNADDGGPSETELRRRDRLRRYKTLLQTQARKIVAAQTAIQRRYADCEMVLSQRQRLASMANELARAEKRVASSKARTSALSLAAYLVVTVGVLAGMSWELSKRIWPGTYVAQAALQADFGRRTPAPEELETWKADTEQLLRDPRLMEFASERMGRRGIASLASPADLSAYLKDSLYTQSSKPGSITIELRSEGAERSEMILDTFVTAYKSLADQSRDARRNDLGVVIEKAAEASKEPMLDQRLHQAGMLFGGMGLGVGLLVMVLWSRMARSKQKFDQAAAVEQALGDVDWSTLEASIRKTTGTKPGGAKSDQPPQDLQQAA